MSASLRRSRPTHEIRHRSLVLLVIAAAWLAGCQPVQQFGDSGIRQQQLQAEQFSADGQHSAAADIYISLAQQLDGAAAQRYQLLAASEQRLAGNAADASATLVTAGPPLDDANAVLLALTGGAVALDLDDADKALREVNRAPPTSGREAGNLLAIKAEALFRLQRPIDATTALTDREVWLSSADAIAGNQRRLWNSYRRYGDSLSPDLAANVDDEVIAGWLDLGYIAATAADGTPVMRAALGNWQRANPQHPANDYLVPQLLSQLRSVQQAPDQVAVLLPLSGRQRSAGSAVRDGLLAAHYVASGGGGPAVRIYDSDAGGATIAYDNAVRDGADFVIGPLLKEDVQQIAATPLTVTTLALNFLPDEQAASAPPGLYQYSLLPEDEARQIAQRAVQQGQMRAIAITPENSWGQRLLNAFADEFQAQGGQILDYRFFNPQTSDYSQGIRELLLLNESEARADRLVANLNVPLEFEPRRRDDIDLIFLAANAQSAKLIRPQLKFHFAGKIPTYSTSAISQPGSRGNGDLDGILFPDLPWLLAPDAGDTAVQDTLRSYWPDSAEKRARLYALGYDAWLLMNRLYQPDPGAAVQVNGKTGVLNLNEYGQIHRTMPWAQFRNGRVILVEPLILDDDPMIDGTARIEP